MSLTLLKKNIGIYRLLIYRYTVFTDSENPVADSHFAFAFTATKLHDIINFEFILLDDEEKFINFPITEDKDDMMSTIMMMIKAKLKRNRKKRKK